MNLDQAEIIADCFQTHVAADFPYINQGGCGVFAYYASRQLARQGISCKIRVSGELSRGADADANMEEICQLLPDEASMMDFYFNGVVFSHIMLELNNSFLLDASGLISKIPRNWIMYHGQMPISRLRRLLMTGRWNQAFDRRQIPDVFRAVRRACEDIQMLL